MQYVNDDMDDLMRRAAENYPLDTSSKDWNKVLHALQSDPQSESPAEKKNNKGRFLWLLLLLPMGLICNEYLMDGNKAGNKTGSAQESESKAIENKKQDEGTNTTDITNSTKGQSKKTITISDQTSKPVRNGSTDDKGLTSSDNSPVNNSGSLESKSGSLSENFVKNKTKKPFDKTDQANRKNKPAASIVTNDDTDPQITIVDRFKSGNDNTVSLLEKPDPIAERDKPVISHDPLGADHKKIVEVKAKSDADNKKPEKKFYVGLMGGADITTIKFQKLEDAGYNYGAIVGYDIAKKWSIESGVFYSKKFYYSDGKHFNTSKVWMPANSKITEVSGNCEMIEIPVSVKYKISNGPKHSWFATAGGSSYFMKKENYGYTYYYGNSGTYANHYREYNSNSKYLFAVVQLSGGYTRRIGKQMDLRVEPYLKLPVSGMGIGKMPFISSGLHLGITRKLF